MINIEKTLELFLLPPDFAPYSGQIQKVTRYTIVEEQLTDHTNVNMTTMKREIKKTSTFKAVAKTGLFGSYLHNRVAATFHEADNVSESTDGGHDFSTDAFDKEITIGPFAGNVYHFGWSLSKIRPTALGYDIHQSYEPWKNTTKTGLPSAPWISIVKVEKTKTGSVSIIPSKKKVTVTNERISAGVTTNVTYTKDEFLAKSGLTEDQVAEMCKSVYHGVSENHETHMLSMVTDLDTSSEGKLKGITYFNGVESKDIPYTSLIASFGKKFPNYVQRWKVYHASKQEGVYGTAIPAIQLSASQDNEINIVKGDSIGYDAATKTLTYIDGTSVVYDIECLPSQGKNEAVGTNINLDTFEETVW